MFDIKLGITLPMSGNAASVHIELSDGNNKVFVDVDRETAEALREGLSQVIDSFSDRVKLLQEEKWRMHLN